ncbi:MAG: Gfo/Idh/MocA family oxidoreductase [Saprospiraceae bacterium]|nr:Gfo/Idh/MocA family oxidoreductase [Saprospiraceae bacterium]
MDKPKEIRWGIIGCGDVCEVKSAPAMQKIPGSSLVAVMRRNATKAEDYAQRHAVPKWYNDAQQLIDDPDVNAVYIATPPSSHGQYTAMAAAAGKPVYVEKPMARTFAECQQMIADCQKYAVPLHVAYYRRSLPQFLQVKKWVDDGAIGAIRMVQIELFQSIQPAIVSGLDNNWRVDPEIAGGGFFYDLASHQLDYLDYLLGPIKSANGFCTNQAGLYEAEDVVSATFQFETGVLGTGSWCFTVGEPAVKEETRIIGEKGQIIFHYFTSNKVRLELADQEEELDFEMPAHIQQPLIEKIVADLMGEGESPSTGESAARTNWVIDQICK